MGEFLNFFRMLHNRGLERPCPSRQAVCHSPLRVAGDATDERAIPPRGASIVRAVHVVRTYRATFVVGIAVMALLVGSFVAGGQTRLPTEGTPVAVVHDADGHIWRLPLDTPTTLEVTSSLGSNTIMVADGAARMTDADCPHGSCLRQTPISETGQQLICLPHQLWVEVVPARGEDTAQDGTQADVDAVGWKDERQAFDVDVTAR